MTSRDAEAAALGNAVRAEEIHCLHVTHNPPSVPWAFDATVQPLFRARKGDGGLSRISHQHTS